MLSLDLQDTINNLTNRQQHIISILLEGDCVFGNGRANLSALADKLGLPLYQVKQEIDQIKAKIDPC